MSFTLSFMPHFWPRVRILHIIAIAMNGKFTSFGRALEITITALVLILCLFADSSVLETNGVIGSIRSEVVAVFRDSGMQWMVFLCVAANFLMLFLLQCRISGLNFGRAVNPSLWLVGLLLIGTLDYTFNYSTAVQPTQALILLAGAALGSGAAVRSMWQQQGSYGRSMEHLIVILPVVLFLIALLGYADMRQHFEYHGYARWSGLWGNPNIFGLLMGVGMILAAGQLVQSLKPKFQSQKLEGRKWKTELIRWLKVIFFLMITLALSVGLMKSYSRGAWLAAICGLAYLVNRVFSQWLRRNALFLAIIVLSLYALAFWQFQHTEREHIVARRALSVGNINDFSWRNRVSAWEGALQIMAEHPVLGVGWNQPERCMSNYYRSAESGRKRRHSVE